MEKHALVITGELKTVVYQDISGFINRVDEAIFKVVIDYIVRNFDPAGINIGGLIDSFYNVLIKPKLLRFIKMFKQSADRCRALAVHLWESAPDGKFTFHQSLMFLQECLKH